MGNIEHVPDDEYRPPAETRARTSRDRERMLAVLADRQHGVVARPQLLALGFGRGAIAHRVDRRRLYRIHRGVYAPGRPVSTPRGRWLAAVFACGGDAVLSHGSAAALWGLKRAVEAHPHVLVTHMRAPGPAGVIVHRTRSLPGSQRTARDRIPITTVARTLLDLAAIVNAATLRRTFEEADRLRLLDLKALIELRGVATGRRGIGNLDALLSELHEPEIDRSELERRFAELCDREDLPRPARNVIAAGFEVDALWPAERLVVELDGFSNHRSRAAFERDRERDAALMLAGFRVLRVTYRRLEREPNAVAEAIRSLLADA